MKETGLLSTPLWRIQFWIPQHHSSLIYFTLWLMVPKHHVRVTWTMTWQKDRVGVATVVTSCCTSSLNVNSVSSSATLGIYSALSGLGRVETRLPAHKLLENTFKLYNGHSQSHHSQKSISLHADSWEKWKMPATARARPLWNWSSWRLYCHLWSPDAERGTLPSSQSRDNSWGHSVWLVSKSVNLRFVTGMENSLLLCHAECSRRCISTTILYPIGASGNLQIWDINVCHQTWRHCHLSVEAMVLVTPHSGSLWTYLLSDRWPSQVLV